MGQVNAPQLQTPMGYDPTTGLWLPLKLGKLRTDPGSGEEYAPLITDDMIEDAIMAGQGFETYQAIPTGGTGSGGIGVFNAATAKNLLIYAIWIGLAVAASVSIYDKTTDFAFGAAATSPPRNRSIGSTVTSLMTVSAAATAIAVAGATQRAIRPALANTPYNILAKPYVVAAGTNGGIAVTSGVPASGTTYLMIEYIEF